MATTVGTAALSGWDEAPSGASLDTASFTLSSGEMLVVLGAWASNDLSVSSVVWDPATNNEALTVRADFYGNFGNIFIATIDSPTAGTGVARVTLSGTPDDNFWTAAIPLSADGTLSYSAVSTAAQASNTDVTSDGTGVCIDVFMDTFTTGATYDSGDQTVFANGVPTDTLYQGDSFYSTGATYKTPGASTTNMNWTGTNAPHHVCVHIAEAAGGGGSILPLLNAYYS